MKTLGILGGMGAEATSLFYKKLIDKTPASSDQSHIPTVMINQTTLPDRSPYILSGQLDPLGKMIYDIALKIQNAGADYIVMPCNTVHVFLPYLDTLKIPIIDMIQETVADIKRKNNKSIGILGTTATIKSNLYQNKLSEAGIDSILPDSLHQDIVMDIIFDVKAGKSKDIASNKLHTVIDHLREQQVDCILLGCTELPLLVTEISHITLCDPLDILATACIDYSLQKVSLPEKSLDITTTNMIPLTPTVIEEKSIQLN
tara:strand:- start:2047 stop:2823 length:777 start_codon:yes stop_codon:yes gene_type:complete